MGRIFVGEGSMTELRGVEPVDGPELAVVDAGMSAEVYIHAPEAVVDLVEDAVQFVDAMLHPASEQPGKPQDARVIMEPCGEQERAVRGQLACALEEVSSDPIRVPACTHDIAEADDQRRHMWPMLERGAELLIADVRNRRAGPSDVVKRHIVVLSHRVGQEACPAAAAPGKGVADAESG